eukprot:TRINITY_DN2305_c0_g1_i1.p1 TRINITY_DN2305_c0_g1~~TRINITY_DN2305_c0_g1_i1.p1  ORF type:complete len:620 (+),score=96.57 TRINITY_DN2305_c0_g1_i1:19-1878(+)
MLGCVADSRKLLTMSKQDAARSITQAHFQLPSKLVLHQQPEAIVLEPLDSQSTTRECLEIDRASNRITRRSAPPSGSRTATEEVYGVIGIIRLVAGPYLIVITDRERVGQIAGHDVWRVKGTKIIPFVKAKLSSEKQQDEAKFLAMLNVMLKTPSFYFSYTYDLTHSLQRNCGFKATDFARPIWERVDDRFFWNRYLMRDFIANQLEGWVLPVMLGFINIVPRCEINGVAFSLILVSRRNVKRAGTRFNVRGVDDQGNVANNIETEQIVISSDGRVSAFVQTRGSIPVFWTQYTNIKYTPPLRVIGQDSESSNASGLHFQDQTKRYGKHVLINLVNQHGSEKNLANAYKRQVELLNDDNLRYIEFDFHKECKTKWENVNRLLTDVQGELDKFGFYAMDSKSGTEMCKQTGTFRTNCIDNLDRTNVVQSMLASANLEQQLKQLGILRSTDKLANYPAFHQTLKHVWADNADALSLQYAGTGALKTDFTRTGRRTMRGALNDGINSLTRYYLNNFHDGFRQDAFDLFLGNYFVESGGEGRSPFGGSFRPIATVTVLFALFVGAVMFLASLFAPAEGTSVLYQFMVMVFWLGALVASVKVLIAYGTELVDKPRFGVHERKTV